MSDFRFVVLLVLGWLDLLVGVGRIGLLGCVTSFVLVLMVMFVGSYVLLFRVWLLGCLELAFTLVGFGWFSDFGFKAWWVLLMTVVLLVSRWLFAGEWCC